MINVSKTDVRYTDGNMGIEVYKYTYKIFGIPFYVRRHEIQTEIGPEEEEEDSMGFKQSKKIDEQQDKNERGEVAE